MQNALDVITLTGRSAMPTKHKAPTVDIAATSKLYTLCMIDLQPNNITAYNSALYSALWGTSRGPRSRQALQTIISKGHKLDINMVQQYQILYVVDQFLRNNAHLNGTYVDL